MTLAVHVRVHFDPDSVSFSCSHGQPDLRGPHELKALCTKGHHGVLTQGDAEAQRPVARTAHSRGAICSGTRYAKWAGSSRSMMIVLLTHRLAAMGGFTQDDGYVRGVVADAQALLRILPRLRP